MTQKTFAVSNFMYYTIEDIRISERRNKMARNTHHGKSTSSKLTKGYLATLWVVGIILFAFFAFAIFAACGGIDIINPPVFMMDDSGNYYYIDDNGEQQYLFASASDVTTSTDVTSPTDTTPVSPSDNVQ